MYWTIGYTLSNCYFIGIGWILTATDSFSQWCFGYPLAKIIKIYSKCSSYELLWSQRYKLITDNEIHFKRILALAIAYSLSSFLSLRPHRGDLEMKFYRHFVCQSVCVCVSVCLWSTGHSSSRILTILYIKIP